MAAIDDPKVWILRLFEMEEREGRGSDCQRFRDGIQPSDLPLASGERVFGIYKGKYFFTPQAFMMRVHNGIERIPWASITNCSSQHGEGKKIAELALTDGSIVKVRVGDFATGWSGRISQLFHQMITKWGNKAILGPRPMTIEGFFMAANDDYCLAPNLDPHPTLAEMKEALMRLRGTRGVVDVLMHILEIEDGVPVSDGVIVRTTDPALDLSDFIRSYHAEFMFDAPPEVANGFPKNDGTQTKMILWD